MYDTVTWVVDVYHKFSHRAEDALVVNALETQHGHLQFPPDIPSLRSSLLPTNLTCTI